jgi:hypothetical protein
VKLGRRVMAVLYLGAMAIFMIAGCSNKNAPSLCPEEAMKIAVDAYANVYPSPSTWCANHLSDGRRPEAC